MKHVKLFEEWDELAKTKALAFFPILRIEKGLFKNLFVEPSDRKDRTVPSFHEIESDESSFDEELIIHVSDTEEFGVNFTWSYDYVKASFQGNYDQPPDDDEVYLTDIDITMFAYYHDGDEHPLNVHAKENEIVKYFLLDYISNYIMAEPDRSMSKELSKATSEVEKYTAEHDLKKYVHDHRGEISGNELDIL